MMFDIPTELTTKVGKAFIGGSIVGGATGAIVGLTQTIDELPLLQLNSALNSASEYAGKIGYYSAIGACTYFGTGKLLELDYIKDIPQVAKSGICGAATGIVIGSHYSWKHAIGGGFLGGAIGAALGYYL